MACHLPPPQHTHPLSCMRLMQGLSWGEMMRGHCAVMVVLVLVLGLGLVLGLLVLRLS